MLAQLSLTEVNTGVLKACVQATLSNGWSTHQVAVEWATGALALLALLSAFCYSFTPGTLAPFRLFDLLYLYQWTASTALLDLNYSSVYRAFTTNFAWAMCLFPASVTSPIQTSINNMRHLTGGNMADATGGSAVALVNRKLSPYNAMSSSTFSASSDQYAGIGTENLWASFNTSSANYVSDISVASVQELSAAGDVQLVTPSSANVLQAGVPIYVNSVGIATANSFMTVFLVVLMIAATLLAVLFIGYCVLAATSRYRRRTGRYIADWHHRYFSFARAWLLRVVSTARLPFHHIRLLITLVPDSIYSSDNICVLSVDAQGFMVVYIPFSDFVPCGGWLHLIFYRPRTSPGPSFSTL